MTDTPKLGITYVQAAQSQKHVPVNEGFRALDALVQSGVLDKDLTAPPASPNEGDAYIVAPGATGVWAGQDNKLLAYQGGAWSIYLPKAGWFVYVQDESTYYSYDGTDWFQFSGSGGGSINPASLVGVNATADVTNKLAVKSDAILFSHDDVSPGSGDVQIKVNKLTSTGNASFLFQTNYSGRAEFGLTGNDDFTVKVSPDNSTFYDGITVSKENGIISQPQCPSFNVIPSTSSIPTGPSTTVINIVGINFNNGGHYNLPLNRFIAPVSGIYLFGANIRLDLVSSASYSRLYVRKNGVNSFKLGHSITGNNQSTNYETFNVSTAVEMDENDYIELVVYINSGSGVVQEESNFWGAKIA